LQDFRRTCQGRRLLPTESSNTTPALLSSVPRPSPIVGILDRV
jgi:hypothetical protein